MIFMGMARGLASQSWTPRTMAGSRVRPKSWTLRVSSLAPNHGPTMDRADPPKPGRVRAPTNHGRVQGQAQVLDPPNHGLGPKSWTWTLRTVAGSKGRVQILDLDPPNHGLDP